MFLKPKRVYLDYAAATPLSAAAHKAMRPYWRLGFANPGSIHHEGQQARTAVEAARASVASVLGVRSSGIVFTGSGTESNNLAIGGALEAASLQVPFDAMEVVTTPIEHPSVANVLKAYEKRGVVVREVPVDAEGRVRAATLGEYLSKRTVLVTVGYVNSEVGTVQSLGAIARAVRAYERANGTRILFHTDAAQAPLWLPCQLPSLGVDLLSLDAGKCGGPKGEGVLAMVHGVTLSPVLFGGGQESGLRSGTENVPGIVGTTAALSAAQGHREERSWRVALIRDELISTLTQIEGVVLNGSASDRVANNVSVSMRGVDGEFAVVSLDTAGFAVSTKSACGSREAGGSAVVRHLTGDDERATTSIRVSLGEDTTRTDVARFAAALKQHIADTRAAQTALTHSDKRRNM